MARATVCYLNVKPTITGFVMRMHFICSFTSFAFVTNVGHQIITSRSKHTTKKFLAPKFFFGKLAANSRFVVGVNVAVLLLLALFQHFLAQFRCQTIDQIEIANRKIDNRWIFLNTRKTVNGESETTLTRNCCV